MSDCDVVNHLSSLTHSLTDDQKVMEQCGGVYSSDYQEILSTDSHVYSSLTDTTTSDDYESIEDIKREAELEWRVLSRLEGEMGEDWRIVNSMPRPRSKRNPELYELCDVAGSARFKEKQKIKDTGQNVEGVEQAGLISISCRGEMREKNTAGCEQAINAKSFLEKFEFLSRNGEDLCESNSSGANSEPDRLPAAYLRKQVTFGKLLVFPC